MAISSPLAPNLPQRFHIKPLRTSRIPLPRKQWSDPDTSSVIAEGSGREGVGQPCCSVRRAGNIARREHGIRDTVPPIFAGGHSNALTNPSGPYQLNLTTSRNLKLQQISNTNIMTSKLEILKHVYWLRLRLSSPRPLCWIYRPEAQY